MGDGIITGWNLILLHEKLNRTDRIYHIFKASIFDEIIRTKTLRFTKVTSWKDPWEFPARYVKEIGNDEYINFLINTNNMLLVKYCAGMCFCKQYDKEAMWQYYTHGEAGVCIETTVEDIIDSLKLDDVLAGFVGPVLYLDFMGENAKNLLVNDDAGTYPSYMYMGYIKRKNYIYEEEIRIILNMRNEISGDFVEIPFDVQKLVKKIHLSPGLSDKEIYSLQKKYCKLNVDIDVSKLYSVSDINIPKLSDEELWKVMASGGLPEEEDLLYYRLNSGEWIKNIEHNKP